ncbi:hypothetical protein [Nocardioides mangrovi]|uniref:Uncharacterized protein n=1 Tax=Nocardioides mangrovi TaxID=2874580 RepID=A0ABS7UEQ5_9ACTN|nr:hypothetical protein [Nocardioides mangrovi]MBZ5739138.1 hypothetical protein [Nocardioides mangrovi]
MRFFTFTGDDIVVDAPTLELARAQVDAAGAGSVPGAPPTDMPSSEVAGVTASRG